MPQLPVAWITHPACPRHVMERRHPESPLRLEAIEEHLALCGLADFLIRRQPADARRANLLLAHDAGYVDSILQADLSRGSRQLDPDTIMTEYTLPAALAAAGGAVLAVDLVLAGEAGLAFCATRPPGHHAERGRAMGFCIFNNIAVAAAHALALGLKRVAVLDFDVHYGNGTADIFRDDPRVLYCSTYQHPLYPGWESDPGIAHFVDAALARGAGGAEFRDAVERLWQPALEAHAPELILVSAGFDAHAADPLANLCLHERDYAWIAERIRDWAQCWSGGRVVATLEGGYEPQALARSVESFLRPFVETT